MLAYSTERPVRATITLVVVAGRNREPRAHRFRQSKRAMPMFFSREYLKFLFAAFLSVPASAQAVLRTVSGGGRFGEEVGFAGDIDGDGFPDAVSNGVVPGSNPPQAQTYVVSGRTGAIVVATGGTTKTLGDLDRDGRVEVLTQSGGTTWEVRAFVGGPVRFYIPAGALEFFTAIGDVNGDGVRDIVRYFPDWTAQILSGSSGAVLLSTFSNYLGNGAYWALVQCDIGDYNHDGISDFLLSTAKPFASSSPYASATVRSGANLNPIASLPYSQLADAATIGDVDADNTIDFAVITDTGGLVIHSGASLQPILTLPSLAARRVKAAGDVDQDGVRDIAILATQYGPTGSIIGDSVQVRSGANGGLLLSAQYPNANFDSGFDVNRDGYPDIVVGYFIGGPANEGRLQFISGAPTPPLTYCQGKINSLGCEPYVWASGSTSRSGPDNLVVHAANVLNNKLGIMFWGRQGSSAPFLGGTLCISTPFKRTDSQSSGGSSTGSDCSGAFSYAFSQAEMAQNGLGVGSAGYCQFWYRDPGFPPPANVGLTNGVVFTVSF